MAIRWRVPVLLLALLSVVAGPSVTVAQVRAVVLGKPLAEHPEALSRVTGFRELVDGRAIVADMGETRIVLLDFAKGTAAPISRVGSGPLEYRVPGPIFAAGDTLVMPDMMLRRFLLIDATGKVVGTKPMTAKSGDILAFVRLGRIVGIDKKGRFYSESRGMTLVEGQMPKMSDTLALVRWSEIGVKGDTITTRVEPLAMPDMQGDPTKGVRIKVKVPPIVTPHLWDVSAVGGVVMLFPDYHTERVAESGQRSVGPRIPHTLSPLTTQDRARVMKRTREEAEIGFKLGRSMVAAASNGQGPKIDFELVEPVEWAKTKPAFGAMHMAPDGRLWVSRTSAAFTDIAEYDVLDAKGQLVLRVTMPPKVTLVGFGKGLIYTVRQDEDDLRFLQRHRLP